MNRRVVIIRKPLDLLHKRNERLHGSLFSITSITRNDRTHRKLQFSCVPLVHGEGEEQRARLSRTLPHDSVRHSVDKEHRSRSEEVRRAQGIHQVREESVKAQSV